MLKFLIFFILSIGVNAAEFKGWEGLRVLPLEDGLAASASGDFDASGRESLFIANRRQSRIDIYRWLPESNRTKIDRPESPNELSMTPDFQRSEISLERPPYDIRLENIDADKELELLVLTTFPLTLHRYDYTDNEWSLSVSWKLPDVELQPLSFLYHENSVLVGTKEGILIQKLVKNTATEWLKPIESAVRRLDWWVHDIDGDGVQDLIDVVVDDDNKVGFRYLTRVNNLFLPAVPLGDIKGTAAALDTSSPKPVFYIQNPIRNNTLNEYVLEQGEESTFGRNRLLPRLNISAELKTTVKIDGKKVLVEVDPEQPLMRASQLTENGFEQLDNFPILLKTTAIAAPVGQPFLLMRVDNSPNLYISRWQNGRFSYPAIFTEEGAAKERKLLGFGRHADTVWWIHQLEDSLQLTLWPADEEKPVTTHFKGTEKSLDQAFWLGGRSLMARKKYAKDPVFYTLKNKQAKQLEAVHLKDAVDEQFRFFRVKGQMKLARIVDGILQWYSEDLQPVDQVMLEDGGKIIDAILLENGSMLVLDQTAEKVHEFTVDKSGLTKKSMSFDIIEARSLYNDPNLGLIFANNRFVNAVSAGRPFELKLKNSINEKLGLPTGVKKATINDFHLIDIAGSSRAELAVVDFQRHQLTVIGMSGSKPLSLASWKVFDDGKYPYSDGRRKNVSRNPYLLISMDFDGDGIKELVMGCHDRLLVYIGREAQP